MFSLGAEVKNQKTGTVGKIIGYGHEIVNGVYLPTLKVLAAKALNYNKQNIVEEDLYSVWSEWQKG